MSQALLLASTPLLMRLYTPSAFGDLANFMAILGVFGVIASFRMELAIGPEAPSKVPELATTCRKIVFFNTTILSVVLFALDCLDRLPGIYWLLAPCLLMTGLIQIYTLIFLRIEYTNILAFFKILQTLTLLGAQFILYNQLESGLIIGVVIGMSFFWFAFELLKPSQFSYQKKSTFFNDISRNSNFLKYSAPGALISTLGMHLPIFAFMVTFSSEIVGLFAVALRLIMAPLGIVSQAITKILIADAYLMTNFNKRREIFKRVMNIQYPIAFLALTGVLLANDGLLRFVGLEDWSRSLPYISIVLPWAIASFFGSPLLGYLEVSEGQKEVLIFHGAMFVIRTAVLISAVNYLDPIHAAFAFAMTSTAIWCALVLKLKKNHTAESLLFLLLILTSIAISMRSLSY